MHCQHQINSEKKTYKAISEFSTESKMKCKQRLCSRTKNIKLSGFCNICDDVIEEYKEKYEAVGRKQRTFPRIDLDLKLLVETHEKLASGAHVEPNVMNMLLLSGVRNVLCQSEEFDEALEKVKVLGAHNTETKFRLESLETWMLKLNDKVEDVTAKMETNEHLKNQVETLRKDLSSLKETLALHATLKTTSPLKNKSCNKCGETFAKNYELETHMVNMHELEKTHKCEICGKTFYL